VIIASETRHPIHYESVSVQVDGLNRVRTHCASCIVTAPNLREKGVQIRPLIWLMFELFATLRRSGLAPSLCHPALILRNEDKSLFYLVSAVSITFYSVLADLGKHHKKA
jgi:hypothetical protein